MLIVFVVANLFDINWLLNNQNNFVVYFIALVIFWFGEWILKKIKIVVAMLKGDPLSQLYN